MAVKRVPHFHADVNDGKRILREVKLLRQLDHPNIITIVDLVAPETPRMNDIYIVTELMETDLSKVIRSKQVLLESHHQHFSHQMLLALRYLHRRGVIHRDLKPANLLVNANCDLKICDFGLARVQTTSPRCDQQGMTDYVVTRWYRAPEVGLVESRYTEAIDVWSAGCILAELINRKPLFEGRDPVDQIRRIVKIIGSPTDAELAWIRDDGAARRFLQLCPHSVADWGAALPKASHDAREAVQKMLQFDPTTRISAAEALKLPYYSLFEDPMGDDVSTRAPSKVSCQDDVSTRVPSEASSRDGSCDGDHIMKLQCKINELESNTVIDWTFDDFVPTKALLQNYLYCECAEFHPDIVKRDWRILKALGISTHDEAEAAADNTMGAWGSTQAPVNTTGAWGSSEAHWNACQGKCLQPLQKTISASDCLTVASLA